MNSPDKAVAFQMSRRGYDVWMGNNRGNVHSQGHVNLTIKDKAFWDFDFEEMGLYDVPAMANHIKTTTGASKISYIGHSEGTTQFFIGASLLDDYYDQTFNFFAALAPIVRLDNNKIQIMTVAAQKEKQLTSLFMKLHIYNLFPRNPASGYLGDLCNYIPRFCDLMVDGFFDWHSDIDNQKRIGDVMSHTPSGAGWRNIIHYAQIIDSKKF
jgi:lysosomal acid lipase/cholesteryl ester hydrolase